MRDLNELLKEASSFPGVKPPEDYTELGRLERKNLGVTILYQGKESGTIYYATERGLKFARHMEEVIRRQKTKK